MIKDVQFQVKNRAPVFFSEEAREQFSCFKENQIVLGSFKGTQKERSIIQMNTYWSCCNYVAQNVISYPLMHNEYQSYIRWSQKELADKQVRKALHFVNEKLTIRIDKETFEFHYRSIAIKNLRHMEACDFFKRAFDVLAARLNVTVPELIGAAKSQMRN